MSTKPESRHYGHRMNNSKPESCHYKHRVGVTKVRVLSLRATPFPVSPRNQQQDDTTTAKTQQNVFITPKPQTAGTLEL